jgi:hypothetical protein
VEDSVEEKEHHSSLSTSHDPPFVNGSRMAARTE